MEGVAVEEEAVVGVAVSAHCLFTKPDHSRNCELHRVMELNQ